MKNKDIINNYVPVKLTVTTCICPRRACPIIVFLYHVVYKSYQGGNFLCTVYPNKTYDKYPMLLACLPDVLGIWGAHKDGCSIYLSAAFYQCWKTLLTMLVEFQLQP